MQQRREGKRNKKRRWGRLGSAQADWGPASPKWQLGNSQGFRLRTGRFQGRVMWDHSRKAAWRKGRVMWDHSRKAAWRKG